MFSSKRWLGFGQYEAICVSVYESPEILILKQIWHLVAVLYVKQFSYPDCGCVGEPNFHFSILFRYLFWYFLITCSINQNNISVEVHYGRGWIACLYGFMQGQGEDGVS